MVVLLASIAAVSFAAGSVLAKRGLQNTNALTALIVSSGVAALILGSVVLLDRPDNVTVNALWLFAAAGIAGDGVGRFSMLGAVDRLGPVACHPHPDGGLSVDSRVRRSRRAFRDRDVAAALWRGRPSSVASGYCLLRVATN